MSEIVQAELPDGRTLWVRVEDGDGPTDTAFGGLSHRLDDLPRTLETVVGSVRSGLRKAAPDEVTLEFGIEISGKSGHLVSVVTGVGGKATLKVSATWRRVGAAEVMLEGSAPPPEEPETDQA